MTIAGCPEDDNGCEGNGADGGDNSDNDNNADGDMPTCGELITAAQLSGVTGGTLEYDESGLPFCEFNNGDGFGTIQAFRGESAYDQMEAGAIASFGEENVVITDNIGAASFEWSGEILGMSYEVGFLDDTASFAVLVVTDDNCGGMEGARQIANIINGNLGSL